MNQPTTPILLLTGYLGSSKTTYSAWQALYGANVSTHPSASITKPIHVPLL